MKNIILAVVAGLGLAGCASPSYNAQPTITNISKPAINTVATASVGEQMLTQGAVYEDDGLIVNSSTKISGYTIHAGQYQKTGENDDGKYFSPVSVSGVPIAKSFIADPFKVVMVSTKNELCVVTVLNAKTCQKDADFKIQKVANTQKDSFQQTLIYSGKYGNKINIGYREFSSSLARPAFNNDVEYDLSESKQIGYKGALLDIIEATNQSITYKVLRNFNKVD